MFIAPAYAATAGSESFLLQLAPMLVIGVLFWFLLIRPQQKRAKEHAAMLSALAKGDEVSTASGILGRVIKVDETYFVLEIADGVQIVVQRAAVAAKLEEGTLKKISR